MAKKLAGPETKSINLLGPAGDRFLVLDGNSLVYRAFHALPLLSNSQGAFTNAVLGFTTMLLKVLKENPVGYVVVAFDKSQATFRQELFSEYKGKRAPTPPELQPQFKLVKELLGALYIPFLELEGYEADDLIGTVVRRAEAASLYSLVLTGDRDALQLISPKTAVLLTKKGISQLAIYDLDTFCQEYGVDPMRLIDIKALMGDSSDNIPGVPGIGDKTAKKLIQQYGSTEEILKAAVEGQADGDKAVLRAVRLVGDYREQALMSKRLATIDCCVPLADFNLETCRLRQPDYERLRSLFLELGFKSLLRIPQESWDDIGFRDAATVGGKDVVGFSPNVLILDSSSNQPLAPGEDSAETVPEKRAGAGDDTHVGTIFGGFESIPIRNRSKLAEFLRQVTSSGELAVYLQLGNTDYFQAQPLALGLADRRSNLAGGLSFEDTPSIPFKEALEELRPYLGLKIYTYDAKKLLVFLRRFGFGELEQVFEDIMIAAYLLNPGGAKLDLPSLVLEHLRLGMEVTDSPAQSAAVCACMVGRLSWVLEQKLSACGLTSLYRELELPLAGVLATMEIQGVAVDSRELRAMGENFAASLEKTCAAIYDLAGEEFNINSTRQLSHILFEKLSLTPIKKTKTGYSTDAEVLEELAYSHEIVARVLEYRQLMKLKSTYVDGLTRLIDKKTSKIHTTFTQTVTATGRLSSVEPNLQNIPVRLELGRRLRRVFVPPDPEWVLMAADYSQIELRILAHISGDENLIAAFRAGEDIHTRTAAEVFGVELTQVTPEMRRRAKAVNFGLVYGISDFGLSRDLGVSRTEAKDYINSYFARYPGINRYCQEIIARARQDGYVTTILKRRRYLPDLLSPNRSVRSFGERTALNTPVQGSAADVIKLAMLRIASAIKAKGLEARMILQVHDELIFAVPRTELQKLTYIVRECMENVYPLIVPLRVDLRTGSNWCDMQALELGR